jgi:FkbM family methyltransferase
MSASAALQIPGTPYLCLRDDRAITSHCLRTGRLDWDRTILDIPAVSFALKPGNVVIDVGAYIGDTTIIFEQAGCIVFAFEPRPDAFACLEINCPRSVCLKKAAGLRGQRVVFSDMVSNSFPGNLGGRQVQAVSDGSSGLSTIALDELNPHSCHFIKVDAEGFEPHVLQGGPKSNQPHAAGALHRNQYAGPKGPWLRHGGICI